jgi:hypothetical protein
MASRVSENAAKLGVELPSALDKKFELLEKIIELFKVAKAEGSLEKQIARVKSDVLIARLGCSEQAADTYIQAALQRS